LDLFIPKPFIAGSYSMTRLFSLDQVTLADNRTGCGGGKQYWAALGALD
jgi:hypothetical protein